MLASNNHLGGDGISRILCALAVLTSLLCACTPKAANHQTHVTSSHAAATTSQPAHTSSAQTTSASPPPAPTPQNPAIDPTLSRTITSQLSRITGRNSAFVQWQGHSQAWTFNNRPQKSASSIKLFILATLFRQAQAGQLDLNEPYVLLASDRVSGTGDLQGMAPGTSFTLLELAQKMITISDNTATNILIRKVGGFAAVNALAKQMGATATQLTRFMGDATAIAQGRDNLSSAKDIGTLLWRLINHQLISPQADTDMLAMLNQTQNHTKLPALLPAGITVYNKTGEYDDYGVENDAAIFQANHRAVVIVVMSEAGQLAQQVAAMNQIGQAVARFLQ